jgi:nucleoside-diphosphate-sugar epimerase
VAPAVGTSDAVVNTVGHYVERGRATFEAIHGQGALHVARASTKAGVKRLVHISGIGADARSPSAYVRARAAGERLVTEAFPGATILRPSVMFGPEDAFFNQLAALARVMPILPLFGSGAVKLQPVYVGDVAEAVARALASEAARGQTYELGGAQDLHVEGAPAAAPPAAWSQTAVYAGSILCLGTPGCRGGAAAEAPDLPRPGRADETRQCGRPQGLVAELGIAPSAVEEILPSYVRAGLRRPAG